MCFYPHYALANPGADGDTQTQVRKGKHHRSAGRLLASNSMRRLLRWVSGGSEALVTCSAAWASVGAYVQ